MRNHRYLIVLMTLVSLALGENLYSGQRLKSRFRPRPEWFAEMLSKPEALSYDEQSDQPAAPINPLPFQQFYVPDYENSASHDGSDEATKFQRATYAINHHRFENLCPHIMRNVSVTEHEDYKPQYEYKPNYYIEIKCEAPHNVRGKQVRENLVCEEHNNVCVQLKAAFHFSKRLRTAPGVKNENCWSPTTLYIMHDCQCMWPERIKGDIMKAHLNFDDE